MSSPKASPRHVTSEQYNSANRAGYKTPRRVPVVRFVSHAPDSRVAHKGEVGFVVDPKLRYA